MGRLCRTGVIVGLIFLVVSYHFTYYEGVRINTNITNEKSRNLSSTNYNLGLKWQCVEFVKRFYYEKYGHEMPNSYGHAITFFDERIEDKGFNKDRGLLQITNNNTNKLEKNDIIVLRTKQEYGHVAIVVKPFYNFAVIAQQNSILKYSIVKIDSNVVCFLRKKPTKKEDGI